MATQDIRLSILDPALNRPVYANGPRDLSAVKLLRISITDRCNFRCVYCMPEDGVHFYDRTDLLTIDDILRVAEAARDAGITHFKLTGGEPTVRADLCRIVSGLKALGPEDLSMTTNGVLLDRLAAPLADAGLDRLTFSLDSLRADRFRHVTGGRGRIEDFWRGVQAAEAAGFNRLKFNVVVIGGFNEDEVADLAALTLDRDWTVRFIEYMPLGESQLLVDGLAQGRARTVDNGDLLERICQAHGTPAPVKLAPVKLAPVKLAPAKPAPAKLGPAKSGPVTPTSVTPARPGAGHPPAHEPGVGPAQLFRLPAARGRIGFISAMSRPFCESCNRLRLTARGELRACLFDGGEVDVMPLLRDPSTPKRRLIQAFAASVAQKPDTHSQRGNRQMSQIGG